MTGRCWSRARWRRIRWPTIGIDLPEDRDYETVAGLALAAFRHLPAEGESFVEQGWRFEVVDLDGRRIDKLLVSQVVE